MTLKNYTTRINAVILLMPYFETNVVCSKYKYNIFYYIISILFIVVICLLNECESDEKPFYKNRHQTIKNRPKYKGLCMV